MEGRSQILDVRPTDGVKTTQREKKKCGTKSGTILWHLWHQNKTPSVYPMERGSLAARDASEFGRVSNESHVQVQQATTTRQQRQQRRWISRQQQQNDEEMEKDNKTPSVYRLTRRRTALLFVRVVHSHGRLSMDGPVVGWEGALAGGG